MRLFLFLTAAVLVLGPASPAQERTLYSTDFTTLDGWTVTTGCAEGYAWAADATPANHPAGPYVSPPASLNFNNGIHIGGEGAHGGAHITCGWVTSDPIDLSEALGAPRLRFFASADMEVDCDWDILSLRVLSAASGDVLHSSPCLDPLPWATWQTIEVALDPSWGAVRIEFGFDTVDGWFNGGTGPFIDDLAVVDVLPTVGTTVCAGDGSGTACPCNNHGASGAGCANSTGQGALLTAGGSTSIAAAGLVLCAEHLLPNQFGTYMQGNLSLGGGNGIVFGDGLRCAGESLVRLQQVLSDASGRSNTSIDIADRGGVSPGDTRTYQLWYRDPGSTCGANFNLTNGVELTWTP